MIWMLRQTYGKARDLPNLRWHQLGAFLEHIDNNNGAFISMNWDTVLDQRLAEIYPHLELFYGLSLPPRGFLEGRHSYREQASEEKGADNSRQDAWVHKLAVLRQLPNGVLVSSGEVEYHCQSTFGERGMEAH
jgi:hypothetical protein